MIYCLKNWDTYVSKYKRSQPHAIGKQYKYYTGHVLRT